MYNWNRSTVQNRIVRVSKMAEERVPNFFLMRHNTLGERLALIVAESARQIASDPSSYLRAAFLPDKLQNWFPAKLASNVANAAADLARHPVSFIKGVLAPDSIGEKRRVAFRRVLIVSGAVHSVLIVYLMYIAILSPYAGIRVVSKDYRKLDADAILKPLYYPPEIIRAYHAREFMKLEEIRRRDRERREREKARREKEERERTAREAKEKAEREKAEREAAALAAKQKAEEEKKNSPAKFGEINEAPIRDIISKVYKLYQAGNLQVEDTKLSMMAAFKIEPDGSLSNIRIVKSSKSKEVDKYAIEILWNLGESHALGPLSSLSSPTIALDLTEDLTQLTIVAFAKTPDEAKKLAGSLGFLLKAIAWAQRDKNPGTSELLSLAKVSSDGQRINARLAISRERATAMMRASFGNTSTPQ